MSTISIRDGQIFLTNASEVTDLTAAIAALVLESLSDIQITSLVDGHILVYDNGTNKWVNQDIDTVVLDSLDEIDGGTY